VLFFKKLSTQIRAILILISTSDFVAFTWARSMLRHQLKRLRALPVSQQLMLLEAALLLGFARIAIAIFPFRLLARWFRRALPRVAGEAQSGVCRTVGDAVERAARNVPWKAVCLPQAIAAKLMLSRRGYPSVVHFGVGRDPVGNLIAHAWVCCGDTIVVGRTGIAAVAPLAVFGNGPQLRRSLMRSAAGYP
jgi:hypothetical protein